MEYSSLVDTDDLALLPTAKILFFASIICASFVIYRLAMAIGRPLVRAALRMAQKLRQPSDSPGRTRVVIRVAQCRNKVARTLARG